MGLLPSDKGSIWELQALVLRLMGLRIGYEYLKDPKYSNRGYLWLLY